MRIPAVAAVSILSLALAACSGGSDAASVGVGTPRAASPTAAGTTDADYCAIVNAGTAFDSDVGTMLDDLQALVADPGTLDSPATLSAVHAKGAELLSASVGTAAYFDQIAAAVNDPTVADAYSGVGDWIVALYQAEGQAAVDAATAAAYVADSASISGSAEVVSLTASRPAWESTLGDYFKATCT